MTRTEALDLRAKRMEAAGKWAALIVGIVLVLLSFVALYIKFD